MAIAIATYFEHAHVVSTYRATGKEVTTDSGIKVDGLPVNPNPVELMCMALAACGLTVMGKSAEKAGISFENCRAEVTDIEEDHAEYKLTKVAITFHLKAEFDDKVRKKMEAVVRRACYVANTMNAERVYTFVYDV